MAIGSPQWMYKSGEAYTIDQSLKFEDGKSPKLTKTFASAGNRRTWTFSCWVKKNKVSGYHVLLGCGTSGDNEDLIYFDTTNNNFRFAFGDGTGYTRATAAYYRDTSAWMHVMVAVDSTQSTAADRIKMYVNGVLNTTWAASSNNDPAQNFDFRINTAAEHYIGVFSRISSHADFYLADMNFIDGQALTPSDFGETGTYGEWNPVEYSGTYGTNGFYLPFKNDYTVEGFSTVTYKGEGGTRYVGGSGFRPSLNWIKRRNGNGSHRITDIVRGANKTLMSDDTGAEYVGRDTSAFKPDGFTNGGNSDDSGDTYVAWQWDMGANTPTGFGCVDWTGNATARSIGGVGFSPDLIIERNRDDTTFNLVYDKIRGAGKALRTNSSNAESSYASDEITAFEPDGFKVSTGGDVNGNNQECIAWCWDMGGTTATNTTGTITSTVMANPTYGQSIISWTGTGATGTVGTGLTSDAELVIVKNRDTADNWSVSTTVVDGTVDGGYLNNNGPLGEDWSSRVDPSASTSNTIGVYNWDDGNKSGSNMIGYAFHSVANYSKISSYTGNGSTTGPSVNIGFRPAFLMIKVADRTDGGNGAWWVFDSTRSFGTAIADVFLWNTTGAELHNNSNLAIDFLDNGFQLKSSYDEINVNNGKYVYMAFAGGVDSVSDFNTDGSLEARVKANPTYGQSVVSYSGASNATSDSSNNSGNYWTVGHGLNSKPEMVIVKKRSGAAAWYVGHKGLGTNPFANHKYQQLQESRATDTESAILWGGTEPTSSVFTVGGWDTVNRNGNDYIAYLWHSVTGYSKFGSYSGTGSSGNSITTGFAPAFLLTKRTDTSDHWRIVDNVRSPSNVGSKVGLKANASDNESDSGSRDVDFTSTGFTVNTTDPDSNASGGTYIYMAFADKREYAYWLDQSGNNNDWTSNNLTESDISVDSPTNNFATLNPLISNQNSAVYSEGNLSWKTNTSGGQDVTTVSTIKTNTGKWYAEFYAKEASRTGDWMFGIAEDANELNRTSKYMGEVATSYGYYGYDGDFYVGGGTNVSNYGSQSGGSLVDDFIIGIAVDFDANKIWFSNDGVWQSSGNPATGTNAMTIASNITYGIGVTCATGGTNWVHYVANFGQDSSFAGNKTAQGNQDSNEIGDFYYTPPTGFLALCTSNLPNVAVTPSEHFNTVTYSGTNSSNAITGVGFQSDLTWIKTRSHTEGHQLVNAISGVTKSLSSSSMEEEKTYSGGLTAFGADGFTVGTNNRFNYPNYTYVAWNWKANGSGSSNTDGSITSTVSANTDAGFSIVGYEATGSAGTVGHGLSKAPEMMIVKHRDQTGTSWNTYYGDNTDYLRLNSTVATIDAVEAWNDTTPTSSVFSIGANGGDTNNTSGGSTIAYCFHSVDGYSKVGGSYTGNGNADGTFVYTGHRPAFILLKRTDSADGWVMLDNERVGYNGGNNVLEANVSDAEDSSVADRVDILSNGFKLRNSWSKINASSGNYIFISFAETPFKNSNGR